VYGDLCDCDPARADIYPGAPELCDGLDNACAGSVPDEDADSDGDGLSICEGDCDDTNGEISPDALEACNGVDDNCDGELDEACPTDDTGVVNGDSGGCGCSASGSSISWFGWWVAMALLFGRRRTHRGR